MLTKVLVAMGVAMAGLFAAERVSADQYVQGYYRQNGSYVQPHYRSNADGNFHNNWSTYPNINPYTGRTGSNRYPSYGSHQGSYRSYTPSYGSYYRGR